MAPTVAIAGPTGKLGQHVVNAFTSDHFRSKFGDIILLSRRRPEPDLSSPAPAAGGSGPITRPISDNVSILKESLAGVDIVVNCLSTPAYETKRALVRAIAESPSVRLYFPSEFGVDHQLPGPDGQRGTDPDFEHPEWRKKKALRREAESVFAEAGRADVKSCHVYPSLMLELSIGSWFGLNVKDRRFEAYGSADQKISWTSLMDIGNAVAALASLPLEKVPSDVRISGDSESVRDVARILEEAAADGESIAVKDVSAEEKWKLVRGNEGKPDPAGFLSIHMGTGKLDFSASGLGNDNELVNPGEKVWKWRTVKDYAIETKGRPWVDY